MFLFFVCFFHLRGIGGVLVNGVEFFHLDATPDGRRWWFFWVFFFCTSVQLMAKLDAVLNCAML